MELADLTSNSPPQETVVKVINQLSQNETVQAWAEKKLAIFLTILIVILIIEIVTVSLIIRHRKLRKTFQKNIEIKG